MVSRYSRHNCFAKNRKQLPNLSVYCAGVVIFVDLFILINIPSYGIDRPYIRFIINNQRGNVGNIFRICFCIRVFGIAMQPIQKIS